MKALATTLLGLPFMTSVLWSAATRTPLPPNVVEVGISSAVAPSPGTVQLQFKLTEPRPIMSSGTDMPLNGFTGNGIAVWSPDGMACGAGSISNGILHFTTVDPTGSLGTGLDYPYLTVTLGIPKGVPVGTAMPFNWAPTASISGPGGTYSAVVKPGSVTVGGSLSIADVIPGGGTYPAGTVVRTIGTGFLRGLRLSTPVRTSSMTVLPDEIVLLLKEQTTLDSQMFQVTNPNGATATYFSYLRGIGLRVPSKGLLQAGEYAFPSALHALATIGPMAPLTGSQYVALALQNPNPGPAAVSIALNNGAPTLLVLPSGTRIVDTVSQLLNGAKVSAGDVVHVTSTAMIQIMGLNADDSTQRITPFVPTF